MSNYLKQASHIVGAPGHAARVSNIIGASALVPASLSSYLNDLRAEAPADVKDSVGTIAGAAAGAILGKSRGHWALGAIAGASIGRNAPALLGYDRKKALLNLAVTGAGILGSLYLKRSPKAGFAIGFLGAEALVHFSGLRK